MASAFGGQRSIQLSYGCVAGRLAELCQPCQRYVASRPRSFREDRAQFGCDGQLRYGIAGRSQGPGSAQDGSARRSPVDAVALAAAECAPQAETLVIEAGIWGDARLFHRARLARLALAA